MYSAGRHLRDLRGGTHGRVLAQFLHLKEVFGLANVKFNIREFIIKRANERFVNSLSLLEKWKERGSKLHAKEKQFQKIDQLLGAKSAVIQKSNSTTRRTICRLRESKAPPGKLSRRR